MTVQCSNEITVTIINMGQQFRGRAGSPSNTKSPGVKPILHTKWHLDDHLFDHNRNGPKIREGAPLSFGGGDWVSI